MTTPAYVAATSLQPTLASQINQFLGTHAIQLLYTGTSLGGQNTAGAGGVNTNSLYLAQSFTPGITQTPGRFVMTLSATGSPAPLTISVQTSSGAAPSGAALAMTTLPKEFLTGSPVATSIPLPCSLTASTQYWIVLTAVGDVSNYYTWYKSNQVSGASTSTNGTAWTGQAYGFLYLRYDQSIVQPLMHTYEDTGARWTIFGYNTPKDQWTALDEYTVGQTATGYTVSTRALAYTAGSLTSVS